MCKVLKNIIFPQLHVKPHFFLFIFSYKYKTAFNCREKRSHRVQGGFVSNIPVFWLKVELKIELSYGYMTVGLLLA